MSLEGGRVEAAKVSPSSGWLGLSVFRLGIDDPSARLRQSGQALLALARDRVQAERGEAADQCGVTRVVCFRQAEQER